MNNSITKKIISSLNLSNTGLTTMEMAKVGLAVTVICLGVSILCIETYGYEMFDLGTYPDWMPSGNITNHTAFAY